MHALIIEDEYLTALDLKGILQDLGFESVEIALCEEDAIEAARRNRPDFITADVRLKQGTGIEALRTIQNELGPIAAIYVTATPEVLRRVPNALIASKPFTKKTIRGAWQSASDGPISRSSF
jgi:CheY-like chemotaxis protein